MRLVELVAVSRAVAETRSRTEKIGRLADCLRAMAPDERGAGAEYLAGAVRQGRVGIGWAGLRAALAVAAPSEAVLTIGDLDAALSELAAVRGSGGLAGTGGLAGPGGVGGSGGSRGSAVRRETLGRLFARATAAERDWLVPLLGGELRQGALDGIVVEAIAQAAAVPAAAVRRAHMLSGSLAAVAEAALGDGEAGLARFSLVPLLPVLPMLASPTAGCAEAMAALGEAALEWKLDGARVQVHRAGSDVRVFSRGLHDVTHAAPEVVAAVRALPGSDLILDGEAIALHPSGRPLPFQTTMRRFGRKLDVAALASELPLSSFFFDVLHAGGETLIDRPARERAEALAAIAPSSLRVPRTIATTEAEADAFFRAALDRGHEGLVAKSLDAPYEAGRRGAAWLKIKPAHTLDLVVLAAEWGSGRRRGFLSNLHLGARDPSRPGTFVMLGKTFKGMTDAMLAFQTERLSRLALGDESTATARTGHVVHVRPELVVEVAFDGVQASREYEGGVALRFARVVRYREDKRADDADTIDAVRAIHLRQLGQ